MLYQHNKTKLYSKTLLQETDQKIHTKSIKLCFKSVAENYHVYSWKTSTHNDRGSQILDLTTLIMNDAFQVILYILLLIHPHAVNRFLFSNTCTRNCVHSSKLPKCNTADISMTLQSEWQGTVCSMSLNSNYKVLQHLNFQKCFWARLASYDCHTAC